MFKDYNMNQLILPLDLEMNLQKNDIAFHIHHLVESIPTEAFAPFYQETGCPSYHPKMMGSEANYEDVMMKPYKKSKGELSLTTHPLTRGGTYFYVPASSL